MGRHLKNTKIKVGEYTVRLPFGSTTQRPASPVVGQMRYNTTTNAVEIYINGNWRQNTVVGPVTIVKDSFSGDGSTTVFGAMSYSYTASQEAQVLVFIDNVHQNPGVAYTFNGTTNITFTSPPPNGKTIIVLHNYSSTEYIG